MKPLACLVLYFFLLPLKIFSLDLGNNALKVDPMGVYKPFKGVTIVSDAYKNKILEEFYKEVESNVLVKKYYSLLPFKSLHMTTVNVATEHFDANNSWKNYINNNLEKFNQIRIDLEKQKFQPSVKVLDFKVASTINLFLELDSKQNKKINTLAEKFKLNKKIPSYFHITLAYLYQNISESELSLIKRDILHIFNKIFITNKEKKLVLEDPKFCYFLDMTLFTPWDGSSLLY